MFVTHTTSSLQNVEGCVPSQLVFGETSRHPSLVEDNSGANKVLVNLQWAQHHRTMTATRKHYLVTEVDLDPKETLKQGLNTEPIAINKEIDDTHNNLHMQEMELEECPKQPATLG